MSENKEFGRGSNAVCLAFFDGTLEIKVLVWLKAGVDREDFLKEFPDSILDYMYLAHLETPRRQLVEDILNNNVHVLRWCILPNITTGFNL